MVAPIVLAAGAAGSAGVLGALAGGGNQRQISESKTVSKKETNTTNIQETSNTSVQNTRTINYNPQVQIDSPDSSISKKQRQQGPSQSTPTSPVSRIPISVPTNQSTSQKPEAQGSQLARMLPLVALAGGAGLYLSGGLGGGDEKDE